MTSLIDPTKPVDGIPAAKSDIRNNWAAAKAEIEELQPQPIRIDNTDTPVISDSDNGLHIVLTHSAGPITITAGADANIAETSWRCRVSKATDQVVTWVWGPPDTGAGARHDVDGDPANYSTNGFLLEGTVIVSVSENADGDSAVYQIQGRTSAAAIVPGTVQFEDIVDFDALADFNGEVQARRGIARPIATASLSSGVVTLDLDEGDTHAVTIDGDWTDLSVLHPPASGWTRRFRLVATISGSPSVDLGALPWIDTIPSLTTTDGSVIVLNGVVEGSAIAEVTGGNRTVAITPTWVGAGTPDANVPNTSTTLTPAYPGSLQAGDLFMLICIIRRGVSDTSFTPPAGWTQIYNDTAPSVNEPRQRIYVRDARATGSESGTISVTYSAGGGSGTLTTACATIHAFRGVRTSAYLEGAALGGDSGGSDTTVEMGTVVPGGGNRLAVQASAAPFSRSLTKTSEATGGTWIERQDYGPSTPGNGAMANLQTADLTSGATISGGVSTFDASQSAKWLGRSFALRGVGT